MNNNEDRQRFEAEQKATARALDAKKRKKILAKACLCVLGALIVLVILWLILRNCSVSTSEEEESYSFNPLAIDYGDGFTQQELDYDIFEDEEYVDKDRGVWFGDSYVSQYYLTENRDKASYQAKLFIDYFDAAVHGDGKKLNTLFTDEYFENKDNPIKKYPDRFPMQKIYDIHVEQLGTSKTENTLEGIMVYEQYKVYFLIMDNNGAFRPDLPVDKSYIPLIYDVITINGESKINRISQYLK